jgi:hypothetical protein
MSKRKADNRAKWENFKKSTSEKRSGKKSDTGSTTNTMEYLLVYLQRSKENVKSTLV